MPSNEKLQEVVNKCFTCIHMVKQDYDCYVCDKKVDMLKAENDYACAYYCEKEEK